MRCFMSFTKNLKSYKKYGYVFEDINEIFSIDCIKMFIFKSTDNDILSDSHLKQHKRVI